MFNFLFFFIVFCSGTLEGYPHCSWVCDNPTCSLGAQPKCDPPSCAIECDVGDPSECSPPQCSVQCPVDQTTLESCPMCETICQPAVCPISHSGCAPLCEPVSCSWKPADRCIARYPRCVLQCESPACLYIESSSSSHQNLPHLYLALLYLFFLFSFLK